MASATVTLPFFISLLLISSTPLLVSSDCSKEQLKSIITFMHDLGVDPTPNTPCCDIPAVDCDEFNNVYGLGIVNNPAAKPGPIPPSIGNLTFIQDLALHKLPSLVGPIPPQLTNLKRLRFLTISWTNISGPVPAFLAQLPNLEALDLSFNNLSGTIPASLGLPPKLISIDISRNQLTGTIPDNLFKSVANVYLVLSHNQLTGRIPPSLGRVNITKIDVSRNRLTGDAGFLFGRTRPMETMDLSRNELEFDLTKVVFPLGLDVMNLEHNLIYGSIPAQISELPQLQYLNVSYNRLCGEIPTGVRLGDFDQYCYFHNKCLCGAPLAACKSSVRRIEGYD